MREEPARRPWSEVLGRGLGLLRRDPAGALLSLRLAGWVVVVWAAARLLPLPRALRLVSPRPRPRCDLPPEAQAEVAGALAGRLDGLLRLRRGPLQPSCWRRAAVLHRFLALEGIPSRIVFGARSEAAGLLAAHAWLETDAGPVLEARPPDFRRLYVFPEARAESRAT